MSRAEMMPDQKNISRREQAEVKTQIAICIPTYKRPDGLCRLLAALAAQEAVPNCQFTIVVVDNEGSPRTKAICDEFASKLHFPLRYCGESRRGLSYVRNKAVEMAREFADALAFIDDDEAPLPKWLNQLVACQKANGADAVTGPVLPYFMGEVAPWIRVGRFFERPRYATGTVLPEARTGNVLIRMEAFDRIGLFDDRFALSGGEDMDFFVRLREAGGLICWSDEAVVVEWVPPSRTNLKYILEGAYRRANVNAVRSCQTPLCSLTQCVHGGLRSMKGMYLLLGSITRGKVEAAKALQCVWSGAGVIAGAAGRRYEQYRTVHSV
jgi:glycosyltransferase involved in cell wall biosynthesis